MLTRAGCEARQERFRALLEEEHVDTALISDLRDIYYLTGLLLPQSPTMFPALLYFPREGRSWLASCTAEGDALVDERPVYEPNLLYTTNPDPMRRLEKIVRERMAGVKPRRIGYQQEALPLHLARAVEDRVAPEAWVSLDDGLARLQKRKNEDEVALLRKAAASVIAAYEADRAAIAPGVNELEVLEAGHRAANLAAGEMIFHSGDYQSGEFGGFARDRQVEAGELYIIDAWSVYHGYWADLCRTFAVSQPTRLQQEIFDLVADILTEVPSRLVPGSSGTALWHWIDGRLREHPLLREIGYLTHGGHGVGTRAHEAPDINRDRDGTFEIGDVVSVEPGGYAPELKAGVRLENTFFIGESGVELLSDFELRLS